MSSASTAISPSEGNHSSKATRPGPRYKVFVPSPENDHWIRSIHLHSSSSSFLHILPSQNIIFCLAVSYSSRKFISTSASLFQLNFTPDTTSVLSSLSTSRQLYHSLNLYHCPIFGTYESNNRLERYQRLAVSFTGSVLPLPDMSRIPMEKRAGRGRDSKFLTSSLKSHCPTIATYML